ncbi:ankyrin repeat domain-containing protein [bacterium]|nr:MAG: ankyrin repeat domain-containing protein [bacterium]
MNDTQTNLDLRQLRTQAKELLKAVRGGDAEAFARARPYFSRNDDFSLVSAQLVIARENGFSSWLELRRATGEEKRPDRLSEMFDAVDALDLERVRSLLRASPNLAGCWRKTDYGGWESVLHVAAKRGSLEIAAALVEAGAEVYAVRQSDYPPVFEARFSGNPELVEYLLAASAERDNGQPPTYGCGIDIVCASRLGMLDRVEMHLTRDPFAVYRRGCIGKTVLHWPAHNGYVDVVEELIRAGAVVDADEIGLYGGKPLHWAAEYSPSTLRSLLHHGADPNSRNLMKGEFEGYTPLHMCARQREECLENALLLLEAGAVLEAKDARGQTPLDVARTNGREQMVEYLAAQ